VKRGATVEIAKPASAERQDKTMPHWYESWLWSVPLILATVVLHVFALGAIRENGVGLLEQVAEHRRFTVIFAFVVGVIVLLVTLLHAVEAAAWGAMYFWLGALPDAGSSMLYSVSAMTTYGHANLYLEPHLQMMGAIEALNGVVLFGLTTATLFSVIDSVSRMGSERRRK
jgi:hypothetical protein